MRFTGARGRVMRYAVVLALVGAALASPPPRSLAADSTSPPRMVLSNSWPNFSVPVGNGVASAIPSMDESGRYLATNVGNDLVQVDLTTGSIEYLAPVPPGSAAPRVAQLDAHATSADGNRVAYLYDGPTPSGTTSGLELFVWERGFGARSLGRFQIQASFPSYSMSADGKTIAISSYNPDHPRGSEIFLVDVDTGVTRVAIGEPNPDETTIGYGLTISGDGEKITYSRQTISGDGSGINQAVSLDITTKSEHILGTGLFYILDPSSDGSEVLIGDSSLRLMNVTTGASTLIPQDLYVELLNKGGDMRLSPDGGSIIFATTVSHDSADSDATLDIYRYDINSGSYHFISTNKPHPGFGGYLTVSGDGGSVAYYTWTEPGGFGEIALWVAGTGSAMPQKSASLTVTPAAQTVGKAVTLTATLRNGDGSPVPDTLVTFGATSGPDAGRFAAIVRTDSTGTATAARNGIAPGTDTFVAWLDSNINGTVDPGEPSATATVTWRPTPVTVLFIQGISSTSTCADSPDFVGRLGWYRSSLDALLGPGSKYIYYGYRSPHTATPLCAQTAQHSAYPHYAKPDACWSVDDVYTDVVRVRKVPNGGEGTRLAGFLTSYLDSHPSETISIVAHSQGGVLATYAVRRKLTNKYLKRIRSIVTLDSPLGGVNRIAPSGLARSSACPIRDRAYDSPYDMSPTSSVIGAVADTSAAPSTKLYTVDADPGNWLGVVKAIDANHSTLWWATAHIQVHSPTHGDVWNGTLDASAKRKLVRFTACAADRLSSDCTTFAKG